MNDATAIERSRSLALLFRCVLVVAIGLSAVACDAPPPRNFADFMEDRIAREGTLARCSQDREAATQDIECANARRAELEIALHVERERRKALELESERKLASLRDQIAARDQAARAAELAEAAAREAAYEAQWASGDDEVPAPAGPGLELIELPNRVAVHNVEQDDRPELEETAIPRPFRRD